MENPDSDSPVQRILLELRGVSIARVRSVQMPWLSSIDWRVCGGDYWVVAGLPGVGKNDLLMALSGIQKPQEGEYFAWQLPYHELDEQAQLGLRRRIGFVFGEGGRLFQKMTVAENVALPVCYHRNCYFSEAQARVDSVLELTGLTSWGHALPGNLSPGLTKRIGLARALALDPEVLILNNPFGGLDPGQTRWWLNFLDRAWKGKHEPECRHATIVISCDNLSPWLERREDYMFALVREGHWHVAGKHESLLSCPEEWLRDLTGGT